MTRTLEPPGPPSAKPLSRRRSPFGRMTEAASIAAIPDGIKNPCAKDIFSLCSFLCSSIVLFGEGLKIHDRADHDRSPYRRFSERPPGSIFQDRGRDALLFENSAPPARQRFWSLSLVDYPLTLESVAAIVSREASGPRRNREAFGSKPPPDIVADIAHSTSSRLTMLEKPAPA